MRFCWMEKIILTLNIRMAVMESYEMKHKTYRLKPGTKGEFKQEDWRDGSVYYFIEGVGVSEEYFHSFFDVIETEEACENCRFFWDVKDDIGMKEGRCRKHGPIDAIATLGAPWFNWPRTEKDLWCGDWEHAKETTD